MSDGLVSLFQRVLAISAYGAAAALVVIAVRFIFKKKLPAWFSYACWGVVLLRLLLPVGALPSHVSIFNLERPLQNVSLISPPTASETILTPVSAVAPDISADSVIIRGGEVTDITVNAGPSPMFVASIVWAAGMILFLLIAAAAHILTLRRLRFAAKLPQTELLAVCAAKAGLKSKIQIVLSDVYNTPVVCGLFRARIILPPTLENAEPDTLRAVLIHEMIHVRRLDLLWNLLGTLALVIHWFNPLIWAAMILSRRDRERSCDERTLSILGDNKKYAETLLTLSALQSCRLPMGALAFGEEGVKERIKAAMKFRRKSRVVIAAAVVLLVITGAALATSAAPVSAISLRQAKSIVKQELRLQYPNEQVLDFTLMELGTDEIFQATGLQVFKIVSGFGEYDAFVIKEGFVVHNLPGRGGYGVNDITLSDFNGDGKMELFCTATRSNGRDGMMTAYLGLYDPWERMSINTGPAIVGPLTIDAISNNEFILRDDQNAFVGHVTVASGGSFSYSLNTEWVGYDSGTPHLSVSAYPNPYAPYMSQTPGMRIDVSYTTLYTGVRYCAENGSFVSWEDSVVTNLGSDVTRLSGHPVYWIPSHDNASDTLTVTILYDVNQPDSVMAETSLPITANGKSEYYIGEGTGSN